MTLRNGSKATLGCFLALVTGLILLGSCGGSSSSSITGPPASSNTAAVTVGFGPTGQYVNGIFTSVTICQHNTSNCQTVDNVLVDTGSTGLRVLNSALTTVPASSLATVTDPASGDAIQECIQYGDTSYTWGPMLAGDVELAGEKTSEIAINVIGGNSFDVPASCITTPIAPGLPNAGNDDTVDALGANGILGIAAGYPWDCAECTEGIPTDDPYYICPGGQCGQVEILVIGSEATNPVAAFSSADNNGVLITLPSIPATGAASGTVSGSLIFGIATQSDNAFASTATVYGVDDYFLIPEATYNSTQYTSPSLGGDNLIILDTGSNGLYFLDATTLASAGIVECADEPGFYCPSGTVPFTVTLYGENSTSGTINFNIANADTLFATGNAAFNDLGGDGGTSPSTDDLDFGLPFFFGRSVYVGMMPATFSGESAPPSAASSATYGYYAF
jgi:hypothetical protein